ncbi:MAG: dihydrofolate reductase [Myxococcales bacterium]|nr:dihydrofolate reductase [Myxococcales bacterium]
MRKLTYHVASTLDGFIADAQDGVAAFPHHGDHVDEYLATLRTYDTIVMGRRTYEFGLRLGVTDPYPWAETYVVSSSMTASPNPHVQITSEDARDLVRRLKSRDGGPVYLAGGGRLARSLLDAGLVDEVIVKLNPVLLGGGVALAPGLTAALPLSLRSAKVHASGVVVLQYAMASG